MFPAGVLQDGAAVLLRKRQHGEILGNAKGQWLKVHIHLKCSDLMLPRCVCVCLVSLHPMGEKKKHSKTSYH